MDRTDNRKLVILRHAKTERIHPDGDWHRSLTARGRQDAAHAATMIADAVGEPDLILSSDAARAVQTASILREHCSSDPNIETSRSLYLAGVSELRNGLGAIDREYRLVVLVGHNPGLLDLICWLSGPASTLDHLPTSAFSVVEGPLSSWGELSPATVTVSPIVSPRHGG
jgi:phosphohistidine phosphatase